MPLPAVLSKLPKLKCMTELSSYLDNEQYESLTILAPKKGGTAVTSGHMSLERAHKILSKLVKTETSRLPSATELNIVWPDIKFDMKDLCCDKKNKLDKKNNNSDNKKGPEQKLLEVARAVKKLFIKGLNSDFPMWSLFTVDSQKLTPSAKVIFYYPNKLKIEIRGCFGILRISSLC